MAVEQRHYTDVDMSFGKHPVTGDILKKRDVYAVMASIRHLFNTSHYDRVFRPELGTNIKSMLFEQMDSITTATLNREIENVIKAYEPRVTLQKVDVVPDYDGQKYDITITFFMSNSAEPVTIQFFMERVR